MNKNLKICPIIYKTMNSIEKTNSSNLEREGITEGKIMSTNNNIEQKKIICIC
jgi:hypothetical protein